MGNTVPLAKVGARGEMPRRRQPSRLHLTVLGSSPAVPNPGGAGSGYLIAAGGTRVLLDCGPGVAGRVHKTLSLNDLDAVIISHLHQDHFIDLLSMRYWVKYGPERSRPLVIYLPSGGRARLSRLGEVLDNNARFFAAELDLEEYSPGASLKVGELRINPVPVRHYIESYAFVVSAEDRQLTYSADAGPCPELVEAARGAHLFLCEASLGSEAEDPGGSEGRGHMAAGEAGSLGREAGARRLLLTHFPAKEGAQRLQAARETFGAGVRLAREGQTYQV